MLDDMAIERVVVDLPDGFVAAQHGDALQRVIAERYGPDFVVESIDIKAMRATATRQAHITEVEEADEPDTVTVQLARGTKPSDGDRLAARLADQYGEGWEMTSFEPFLGKAVLTKLSPDVARCRGAVAVALSVKPWDVAVTARADGGFDLALPKTYVPSKHDKRLDEVATSVVGREGWWVDADPASLRASIIPGDPPTFPEIIPYDFDWRPQPGASSWATIPIGRVLGRTGGEPGDVLTTDFAANPHMLVSGVTGGGKGVTATAIVSGALAAGWQLAIVDAIKAGVDYADFTEFVRDGCWGDDLATACCVLNSIYAEGVRRKQLIRQHGVKKWTELPPERSLRPILVLVDEFTSLIGVEAMPKGVAKDHPLMLEVAQRNLLRANIISTVGKIARELRFTGVSLLVCTQAASTTTGVPTELRLNLTAKILLGSKPTENNRRLALDNPQAVPYVPANVADGPAAGGVGVFEFQGVQPGVMKAFFATTAEFSGWLTSLGVETNHYASPTPQDIARFTPTLDGDEFGEHVSPEVREKDSWDVDPETGKRLTGFERANLARHIATEESRAERRTTSG